MTNEQINIAIAESLGWKVRWQNQGGAPALENKPAGHCWAVWTNPNGWVLDSNYDPIFPPNYTADLNACVEFVKTLSDDQRREYILRLCLGDDWRSGEINVQSCIYAESAPPRDRCETYLRTIRKEVTP